MRVLLVDRYSACLSSLQAMVEEGGLTVISMASEEANLHNMAERKAPEAIIVGADGRSRNVLVELAMLGREYPTLMLSPRDDRRLMAEASDAGIAAFVMEDMAPLLLRSLVDVAVRQFRQVETLRRELAEAREVLADRQIIHRAKCLLMEHEGVSEQAAYVQLRKTAMDRARPIVEIARQIMMRVAE